MAKSSGARCAMDVSAASGNLYHQLMQREAGSSLHANPRDFAAHLYRERYRVAKDLFKTDLQAHYGCVNAIEFSNGGEFLASGGDDKRVLIWNVEKAIAGKFGGPRALDTEHSSNIFCLCFDRLNQKVLSGGNDDLVIVHDFETGKLTNVYKHENPVYGISIDPQSVSVFASASEDGRILVYDQRIDPSEPFVLAQVRSSFHAVEFHPVDGNYLVTANSRRGAAFWDIRHPHQPVIQYGYVDQPPSCMSVRFNSTGSLVLALRRRLPPILYNTKSPDPICTFYHGNYYNSCTMKSCTFAGEDDEFVLSGSDDFNLYVWRVSDVNLEQSDQWIENTQMILYGHRSIVNQVRYNRQKCLLASSGVEKIVKLWSPFEQKDWTGSLLEEATCSDNPRDLYSPYNYNSSSTQNNWSQMSQDDYSSRNTSEDPRMMAFFDSLIQQEIEGWNSDRSTDSERLSADSESENSPNESSDDDNDDNDDNAGGGYRQRLARRHVRNLVKKKERKHRNSVWRKITLQRHKYPNRIAYLIATKRKHLRKLAIRDAAPNNRRLCKVGKIGRYSRKGRHLAENQLINTSHHNPKHSASSSVPSTKSLERRSHFDSSHAQRKKHRNTNLDDSSSNNDNDDDDDDDDDEDDDIEQPPVPSTSTGITSSLKEELIRFRRHQQQQLIDSDEDDDDDDDDEDDNNTQSQNAINRVFSQTVNKTNGILKLRASGEHADDSDSSNTLSSQMSRVSEEPPYRPNGHKASKMPAASRIPKHLVLRTQLPQSTTDTSVSHRRRPRAGFDDSSSHSNLMLSNDDEPDASTSSSDFVARSNINARQDQRSKEHLTPIKKRKLTASMRSENEHSSSKRSARGHPTADPPDSSSNNNVHTPDSGISVATPSTSSLDKASSSNLLLSPSIENANRQHTAKELFQQRVAHVKRNYRHHFANDSDSD